MANSLQLQLFIVNDNIFAKKPIASGPFKNYPRAYTVIPVHVGIHRGHSEILLDAVPGLVPAGTHFAGMTNSAIFHIIKKRHLFLLTILKITPNLF